MREIVVNRRVTIIDNIFYLLKFFNDELTAFEDIYLDIDVFFSCVYCCMCLTIIEQGVEL